MVCWREDGRRERRSDRGGKNGDQMGEEGGLGGGRVECGGLLVGDGWEGAWGEVSSEAGAACGLIAHCPLAKPGRGSTLLLCCLGVLSLPEARGVWG